MGNEKKEKDSRYVNKIIKIMERTSARAPFATKTQTPFRSMTRKLFIVLVFLLMSLPLFTTFNEILTRIVERSGIYQVLTKYVVPFETRVVSVVLTPFGIKGTPTESHLFITRPDKSKTGIYFSWNCLGWQSAILLILTLATGLIGNFRISSKLETVIFGLTGTFLINILRISVVVLVAYFFGQLPAIVIHDYGGTLFTICWFFFFWWFSYTYILEE